MPADVVVVVVDSSTSEADLDVFYRSVAVARELGLDCEGVDLGAFSQLTLVQVAMPDSNYFLFDMVDKPCAQAMAALKEALESSTVVKIIHDCKADSLALFAEVGITLRNVHDTMAWQQVLLGGERMTLNRTLAHHGIAINGVHNNDVYKTNKAFWAERPLTVKMIEWASADVAALFTLRERQSVGASHAQAARSGWKAKRISRAFATRSATGCTSASRRWAL
mmetsp:Transcript_17246/g.39887  ORF Transcript_17246/g.39887 Transcript_17246/m.39887 type:complete len:223 (+) Transcript_17246:76-744(+)